MPVKNALAEPVSGPAHLVYVGVPLSMAAIPSATGPDGTPRAIGLKLIGMAETIYGLLFMLFRVFLPSGIYGSLRRLLTRRPQPALGRSG